MKKNEGITLIALIITIIILIILTAVTINNVIGTDLIGFATKAVENYTDVAKDEADKINELLNIYGEEKANPPELSDGMIPIKYDNENKTWVICTKDDPEWYNYTTEDKKWANVMLSDGKYKGETATAGTKVAENDLGSMFVWIPRYAYKILSGYGTSETGEIDVVFLNGTSDYYYDKEGNRQTAKREIDADVKEGGGYTNYVVHPVFRDGDAPGYEVKDSEGNVVKFGNGEWDEELPGFWVAKFPAGMQRNKITDTNGVLSPEVSNTSDIVVYSDHYYSSYRHDKIFKNALGQEISEANYMKEKLSYPVFKPLMYAYDLIGAGDEYILSKEVAEANNFYGLNASKTDSHLMKNSEWGAVVYLAYSQYGRDGEEANMNNYWIKSPVDQATERLVSITGIYKDGTSGDATTDISAMNAYYTEIGLKGSSTENITGVYDLNGCIWERTAAYIANGDNFIEENGGELFSITNNDENAYKNNSTKYITIYPFDSATCTYLNNFAAYKNKKSSSYGYGDAILEISSGSNAFSSWNMDYSIYSYTNAPFFLRGGREGDNYGAGLFACHGDWGTSWENHSFRVALVCE